MPRQSLAMAMLFAMALGSDSSGSFRMVENDAGNAAVTVDDTHNTTVMQPADDFLPTSNGGQGNDNDEASKAVATAPSGGNGGDLSKLAVGLVVSVTVAGLGLGVGMVVYAWRASRREEEAMFMDVGDESNYAYGRFGDYAAM